MLGAGTRANIPCLSSVFRHTEELSKRLVEWNVLEVGFINSREHAFLSAMISAHSPDVMDRRLDTYAPLSPFTSHPARMFPFTQSGLFRYRLAQSIWLMMIGRFADDLYDFDNLCPLSSWALRMLRRFSTFVQEDDVKDADRKVGF